MSFRITCPHCGRDLDVADAAAGQVVSCPVCRGELVAPTFWQPAPIISSPPRRRAAGVGQTVILAAVVGAVVIGTAVGIGVLLVRQQSSPDAQDLARVAAVPSTSHSSKPATPAPRPTPREQRPTPKVEPDRAAQVRALESEAMSLFRRGKQTDGFNKLLKVGEKYQHTMPSECSREESLAVAKVYVRILAVTGRSLEEKAVEAYAAVAHSHAVRAGIEPADYDDWFKSIVLDTVEAYRSK
jgi:hypothetical protein